MSDAESEQPNLAMYLLDFETEVRRIDSHVFLSAHRQPSAVHKIEESDFPELSQNARVIAHFSSSTPRSAKSSENVLILPIQHDYYVLRRKSIAQHIAVMFRQGYGDIAIHKLWFRSAVALVRSRVLFHAGWFPHARLRTCESFRRYAGLFGATVFAEISRLPDLLKDGKHYGRVEIDLKLTQLLVEATLENGEDESVALAFLTTD